MSDEKKFSFELDVDYHLATGSDWADIKTITNTGKGEPENDVYSENELTKGIRKAGGIFINDRFLELWNITSGLLFLDGGYGSSKTTYAITRLLVKCLSQEYFKCFYGRQKKTEARELKSNIIREIKRNNWEQYFKFSEKPNGVNQIYCTLNGNSFEMFGCDDDESLKGIDNPTDILIDEINQISFESFGMLFTRLRTSEGQLQLIGCFNNCDVYPDHWLCKYIYFPELNTNKSSDEDAVLLEALMKSNIVRHHSTYLDNHFQNPQAYLQKLIIKAGGDPEKIKAYAEGGWGVKLNAQPYYKSFNKKIHVGECIINGWKGYNPDLPLHLSWDENVNPYLPVLIIQCLGNEIYLIDEIAAENPYNTLNWVCREVKRRYPNHKTGVYIYGDATSKKEDVKLEKGKNMFTFLMEYLESMRPTLRVSETNPNNKVRGDFANAVFAMNFGGLNVTVSSKCVKMIEDFVHCAESPDGNGKDKTKTKVNGISGVQKYGHFGDCFDYFLCEAYRHIYMLFQSGGQTHEPIGGGRIVNNSWDSKRYKEVDLVDDEDDDLFDDDYDRDIIYAKRPRKNGY